jgi:hypothetical protein
VKGNLFVNLLLKGTGVGMEMKGTSNQILRDSGGNYDERAID